jgi:hypothetical protein
MKVLTDHKNGQPKPTKDRKLKPGQCDAAMLNDTMVRHQLPGTDILHIQHDHIGNLPE